MRQQRTGLSPSESGAMFSGVGLLVAFSYCLYKPFSDWAAGQPKEWMLYVRMVLFLPMPLLAALLFFGYRVRKGGSS